MESLKKHRWLFVVVAGALLAACDVDQTREGRLPDVDVSVEGGQLPEFEVETADVEVGTREATVKVPDVDVSMEDATVTIPTIDVEMPDDHEQRSGGDGRE